jgi:hypothetical protein
MKNLIIILLLISSFTGFSQNGYTLEFETTLLLSHDTTATIPTSTTKIKQYTVPAGMVLKINAGVISDFNSSVILYVSELLVGNQVIKAPYGFTSTGAQQFSTVIGGGTNGVQPIWANEGTLVQLKWISTSSASGIFTAIRGCWVSGVLFRKIPN